MSISLIMRMIDPAVADEITRTPEKAGDVLFPKLPQTTSKGGFLSFLGKSQPKPQVMIDWKQVYHVAEVIDLQPGGEALHYLLTGGSRPFEGKGENEWICPGSKYHIGSESEAIFLIHCNEVFEFLAAVRALDEPMMRSRFNPSEMNSLPIGFCDWTDSPEDHFQIILTQHNQLLNFLTKAHEQGKALLSGLLM
jgi:hypothetical protein